MVTVILSDKVASMLEVGKGFPSGIVEWIAFPQDEVLELAAVAALVQDSFYLILRFLSIEDLDRERDWLNPALEFFNRLLISLEEGDVEDRVDVQGVGEPEAIGP